MEYSKASEDSSMSTMIIRTRRISATWAISKILINAICTHQELTMKMENLSQMDAVKIQSSPILLKGIQKMEISYSISNIVEQVDLLDQAFGDLVFV